MSWIKAANKLGRYIHTKSGFRVYMVKDGQCIETITVVDGVERIHTQFINSVRIAINKRGVTFTGNLHYIAWKIEKYKIEQYYGGEFRTTSQN